MLGWLSAKVGRGEKLSGLERFVLAEVRACLPPLLAGRMQRQLGSVSEVQRSPCQQLVRFDWRRRGASWRDARLTLSQVPEAFTLAQVDVEVEGFPPLQALVEVESGFVSAIHYSHSSEFMEAIACSRRVFETSATCRLFAASRALDLSATG